MKKLKKVIVIVIIVIVALFVGIYTWLNQLNTRPVPDYGKDVRISGLKEEVVVYRDAYAIPHIIAKNNPDLYRTTGYILAQERLWQMDLLRRVTLGRLSEIFGEDFVETDALLRSLRFTRKSETIIDSISSDIMVSLNAFADGINQYIESNQNKLPVEFFILGYKPEKWEVVHTANLIGYMAWDLKAGWSELMLEQVKDKLGVRYYQELLPDITRQRIHVYEDRDEGNINLGIAAMLSNCLEPLKSLDMQIFDGSNNWAVSGDRAETGMPLFANDMHLGFGIPGVWFQIHQMIPEKLNVTGLLLPGQPYVIVGHNDSIAWGMTNTYVDNMDFYEEKINPDNENEYEYDGEWKSIEKVKEQIKIKKGGMVEKEIRFTHRGPIISEFKDIKDKKVSMHWVGDEFSNELRSVYKVNRANNWEDFKDAMSTFISISQNVNYADKSGNIGLYSCAGVPVRDRSYSGMILPGWTSQYDWKRMIPFEDLPHEYNPERGYVSSANNKTIDESYPYHIGKWYDLPYRITRIREMLEANDQMGISDFMEMQADQKSAMAKELLPEIINHLNRSNTEWTETELKIKGMLESWNFDLNIESPEALIFETLYVEIIYGLFHDEMGDELFNEFLKKNTLARYGIDNAFKNYASSWYDDVNTKDKIENLTDIVIGSFRKTVSKLIEIQGKNPEKWKWGKVHQLTIEHPLGKVKLLDIAFNLNRGPYEVGGSFHTVSPYNYILGNPSNIQSGSSHRTIYSLENWDNSISIIPTGNSGIPGSKYYCDQTEKYISFEYHPEYFSLDSIEKYSEFKMFFIPE